MFKIVLLAFLVTACGTDDRQTAAAPSTVAPKADNGALYIDKAENRPDCTDADEQRLIYVVADKAFYTCHEAAWVLIDIEGKDGRDGRSGTDGGAGKDGKNGVDGKAGADGKDYHDSAEVWFDPFTGASWLKMVGEFDRAEAVAACAGEFRIPTGAEAHAAVERGLAREFYDGSAIKRMWVSDLTASGYSMAVDLWSASTTFSVPQGMGPAQQILAYCIKAP